MTCTKCGATDRQTSEVREHDGTLIGEWCSPCWNQSVADRRAARKTELDAMPRCAKSTCSRRGSWEVGLAPTVLLCGQHKNAARRIQAKRLAPMASIAMFSDTRPTGEQVLAMLEGEA